MDANLASVHSAAEYFDIQMMIVKATHGYGETWLGGSDCQNVYFFSHYNDSNIVYLLFSHSFNSCCLF